MKKFLYTIIMAAVLPLVGCQEPEELLPATANKGVNNMTVYTTWEGYHTADASGFGSVIDYEKKTITVQVPYTLPVESDNVQSLENFKKVWVLFNLDDNVTVEPALTTIDLTQTYEVVITDQLKNRSVWTIGARLAKSSACDIESFSIPSIGATAVIDKNTATASLIYFEELKNVFAEYTLSPHARIVPDPAETAFWCSPSEPKTFTVIAQDGVTSRKWTLQQNEPARYPEGIRPNSAKLLWAVKLSSVGVTTLDKTTGIGATDDYVILNTRGEDPILLDAKSGAAIGTLPLGSAKGENTNYYLTTDHKGHIIINNHVPNDGDVFRVWRMRDIQSTPELFIQHQVNGDVLGDHISVWGDVYGDAAIQTVYNGWTSTGTTSNYTWLVKGGNLVTSVPHWNQISGVAKGWTNGDAIRLGTELTDDYFACGYSMNQLTWVNGTNDTARTYVAGVLTGNEGMKAVDAVNFNGINYVMTSMETFFTWGCAGAAYVLEAKYPETFNGSLELDRSLNPECVIYDLDRGDGGYGVYGGRANDGVNSNAISDVKLHVTSDGYFMYGYFMFCNGYVGCIQFDCIAE